ncbi:hypothetical protein [Falsiroseomonas sp. E2-1-a20]|uniref:hypothetical protein n=1 Tax=Falsiroseomonas sp. E2-1-a20 TaxID=3239300 RepID=UPI003F3F504D
MAFGFSRESRLQKALLRDLPQRLVDFDKEVIEVRRRAEWPAEGQQVLEPAILTLWAHLVALRGCGIAEDAVLRLAEACQECTANHVALRIAPQARNPDHMSPPQRSLLHNAVVLMHGRIQAYDEAYGRGKVHAFEAGDMQLMGPLLAEFCRNLVGPSQAARFQDRTQPALAQRIDAMMRQAEDGVA